MPPYRPDDYASMVINMSQLSDYHVYSGTSIGCPLWCQRMLDIGQLNRRAEAVLNPRLKEEE